MSGIIFNISLTYFLRQSYSLTSRLTYSARQAEPQGYSCFHHSLPLHGSLELLYQLGHLPRPWFINYLKYQHTKHSSLVPGMFTCTIFLHGFFFYTQTKSFDLALEACTFFLCGWPLPLNCSWKKHNYSQPWE